MGFRIPPPDWHLTDWPGAATLQTFMQAYDNEAQHAVVYDHAVSTQTVRDFNPTPRVASIRKCWGGMPYVGQPSVYVWYVAVDRGVYVASSPAVIHRLPKDWTA